MPHLQEQQPASAAARPDQLACPPTSDVPQTSESSRWISPSWSEQAGAWLRSAADTLVRMATGEPVVERFADLAASAREPEEVRVELVRLAWKISGATRVELYSDRNGRVARRLTCWPPVIPIEITTNARSAPRGPIAGHVAREVKVRSGPLVLQISLKAGDVSYGILRLTSQGRRPWSARVVHRLSILCAIASVAERGLSRQSRTEADPGVDSSQPAQGSMILAAFLSFAQAQARRRHESLSLLEVEVDRLDSIRELLGNELAEAAIERVCRAIKATVRASDVVTRLEDGRISVILPNAKVENASNVAEAIRSSIARAGTASTTMPSLTASMGLATYPDHAHDVATLRAAVASTLTRAREQGHDQLAIAMPIPALAAPILAHRVG